jgi:hypothetical protein
VVLLATEFSQSPSPEHLQAELQTLVPTASPWRSIRMHELEGNFGNPWFWHVYSSMCEWHPGLFDPIVGLVADDVIANVLVVKSDCQWVLHPYDGGTDVIVDSSAARDRLKASHTEWLSARPDGL